MIRKIFPVIGLSLVSLAATAQLEWPAQKQLHKPWARWWWQGSAVKEADLLSNLQDYAKVGLGGLEITPIYGVKGTEKDFLRFLSPGWMDKLEFTIAQAKKLGLGIDIANGTGWPFGGPWIGDNNASKSFYIRSYELSEGKQLSEPVQFSREGFVRTANNKKLTPSQVKDPVNTNEDLQAMAIDQVQFPGLIQLQTLMAYGPEGKTIDLTAKVDKDGKLNWTAPAGNWKLYALFQGLHGKFVERAAPGGEGYAIDHFSAEALDAFLQKFDSAFKGRDLSYIRALFNDSYEVDDARGQSNWTPKMLDEFRSRRGYDLTTQLPALFQQADAESNKRVLYDYRATIDELILEYFTRHWKKWADKNGKLIRNQSHGSPANLLDLYSAIDIPETEGDHILRFKFATSAANVTGKQLASSESATWLNEHFLSNWADVKKKLDLFFLGGVNHVFYHGVNYSPVDEPWPGWLFYAATHFQQTNPMWKDFGTLNAYVTRVQSFLQQGRPDNDVLVYFPIADRYMTPGKEILQHFDGMERQFEGSEFEHVSEWLQHHGYRFDFFSDRQMQNFNFNKGILTGGNQYQVILFPANEYVTESTFSKMAELVNAGATILFYKQSPSKVVGLHQWKERQSVMDKFYHDLNWKTEGQVTKAVYGSGMFMISSDMESLLQEAKVRKEALQKPGLDLLRRKSHDGLIYFLNNRSDSAVDDFITLNARGASVAIFDPMTGQKGLAQTSNKGNATSVRIQLKPWQSVIIRTYDRPVNANGYAYTKIAGNAIAIPGNWKLKFISGGPVLPKDTLLKQPGLFHQFPAREYQSFSGTVEYTSVFQKPSGKASAYLLKLKEVHETAEILINGRSVATLIGPSYETILSADQLSKHNIITIRISTLMANRISYMDKEGIEWKKFYNINMSARKPENVKNGVFDASAWNPLPSGLSGEVTLTPVELQ